MTALANVTSLHPSSTPTPSRFPPTHKIQYHCPHLSIPHPPLPPPYLSSSTTSLHPLPSLYFCEECDAIRCPHCVAIEVASYFCPNCLFDVPSANVRGDKNRCARSCFECPICETALSTLPVENSIGVGVDKVKGKSEEENVKVDPEAMGTQYLLVCPSCKWSSKEVDIVFDKPTGLASQLAKLDPQPECVQSEFDALKDHLETYISNSATALISSNPFRSSHTASHSTPSAASSSRHTRAGGATSAPSRHISQLTQMAAKALHMHVPGMLSPGSMTRLGSGARRSSWRSGAEKKEKVGWEDEHAYVAKKSWKDASQEGIGNEDESQGLAPLDRRWTSSWATDNPLQSFFPRRIPLQAKLTKRCPNPACRHLLIQPDTKGVRMKIKMVAVNYLPTIEIGRRRRRIIDQNVGIGAVEGENQEEDRERKRRDRRRTKPLIHEVEEEMGAELIPGEMYSFQVAFTNPLYDPIQIRLSTAHQSKPPAPQRFHLAFPTPHFTVGPLKDAWAYVEEDEDDGDARGKGGSVDESGQSAGGPGGADDGSLGTRSRMSVIHGTGASGVGSLREKRGKGDGIEKKGNVSKVGLELDLYPEAKGPIQADLEVRYTYRADEPLIHASTSEKGDTEANSTRFASGGGGGGSGDGPVARGREEFKTFTFWVRVEFGIVR